MADEADVAGEFQEAFLASSLAAQRAKVSDSPKATGKCLFCEEILQAETPVAGEDSTKVKRPRWCDKDCMDDWQREEDGKRRKSGRNPVVMPLMMDDDDEE
jgi:hypothetical protein